MAEYLDVWLKFESDDDDDPTLEANTRKIPGGRFAVDWYHVDVGVVSSLEFGTLAEAHAWYERNGFTDYTA